jgi:hypothetical protein
VNAPSRNQFYGLCPARESAGGKERRSHQMLRLRSRRRCDIYRARRRALLRRLDLRSSARFLAQALHLQPTALMNESK